MAPRTLRARVSRRAIRPRAAAGVLALATLVATSGCALLLPPSWRGSAPVPLAGPIEEADPPPAVGQPDPRSLSDAELRARVESDQQRLIDLASAPGEEALADDASQAELREIAERLPALRRELERRGRGEATRTHHPVIR